MRYLVINADDYGMMAEVNQGISQLVKKGIVTSVSVMINGQALTPGAVRFLKAHPQVGVGLHLNLTEGRPTLPLSKVRTLVSADGRFFPYPLFTFWLALGRVDLREVWVEWQNQLRLFTQLGFSASHCDSHQHLHLHPKLFPLVQKMAENSGIKMLRCHHRSFFKNRLFLPLAWKKVIIGVLAAYQTKKAAAPLGLDQFCELGWEGIKTVTGLLSLLKRLEAPSTELALHPALLDNSTKLTFLTPRQVQLDLLRDERVGRFLKRHFQLINYHQAVEKGL